MPAWATKVFFIVGVMAGVKLAKRFLPVLDQVV